MPAQTTQHVKETSYAILTFTDICTTQNNEERIQVILSITIERNDSMPGTMYPYLTNPVIYRTIQSISINLAHSWSKP